MLNTTIPMYHFRSETDIKAPFKDIDKEIDVKLLDLSTRKLRFYEKSKSFFQVLKLWLYTHYNNILVKKIILTDILNTAVISIKYCVYYRWIKNEISFFLTFYQKFSWDLQNGTFLFNNTLSYCRLLIGYHASGRILPWASENFCLIS